MSNLTLIHSLEYLKLVLLIRLNILVIVFLKIINKMILTFRILITLNLLTMIYKIHLNSLFKIRTTNNNNNNNKKRRRGELYPIPFQNLIPFFLSQTSRVVARKTITYSCARNRSVLKLVMETNELTLISVEGV